MDIHNIRAFIKVGETESFSRAAEALHLTQPAVSKRIQAMEQTLDIKLFDRIGKRITLTEAGHAILPSCSRILAEMDEARRIISNLRDSTRGSLSLATSHHIGLHRLPPVLRGFTESYPEIELDLSFMDSEQACQQVLQGTIDLAVITLPDFSDARLKTEAVWQDLMVCMVAQHHVLARYDSISKDQLLEHAAILPSTGSFTRNLIDRSFSDAGKQKVLMETHYLETIKAMVKIGLGWAILPASMQDSMLHTLEVTGLNIKRELGMVYHRDRTHSSATHVMLEQLRKCAHGVADVSLGSE